KTEYMLVRYAKKELTIPPGDGAASPALAFTEQRGQLTDTSGTSVEGVRFYSTGSFPPLYVKKDTLSFVTASVDTSSATPDTLHRVDITFFDSKTALMSAAGLDKLDNYRNYYLGHIPEGRARVGQYGRVAVTDLYDGIDLQMFADESGIVYYFVIQPGGDPDDLKLDFHGQDSLYLKARNLFVGTSLGDFNLPAPKAFQIDSLGQEVSTAWKPEYSIAGSRVSFSSTGSYDSTKVLVVELRRPEVTSGSAQGNWITHFGGEEGLFEDLSAVEVDEKSNIYVSGFSEFFDFPLVPGELTNTDFSGGNIDAFVGCFNSLAVLKYLTFIGGGTDESSNDVAIQNGKLFLVGSTSSDDFPLDPGNAGEQDAFVSVINAESGGLELSKIFGGSIDDTFLGVASYGSNILIVGSSASNNILTESVAGAYNQTSFGGLTDGFIIELSSELQTEWATFFGGQGEDSATSIAVDASNNHFYVSGNTDTDEYAPNTCLPPTSSGFPNCKPIGATQFEFANGGTPLSLRPDIFIAEFDQDKSLVWSTFYGGESGDRVSSQGNANLAVNSEKNGEIALIGATFDGSSLPNNTGGGYNQDISGPGIFLVKFKNRVRTWGTGFGCLQTGTFPFEGQACTYDNNGNLFILGYTDCGPQSSLDFCTEPTSSVFPICPPSSNSSLFFQGSSPSSPEYNGNRDVFITSFNASENIIYSTYFGGNGKDLVRDATFGESTRLHFVGQSESSVSFPWDFPTSPAEVYKQDVLFGSRDGYIARLLVESLVSTNDIEPEKREVKIFPNPNPGQFEVQLPQDLRARNWPFRIHDNRGALIYSGTTGRAQVLSLDLSYLPTGVYSFSVQGYSSLFLKY
ncbi:hypothetical protein, partial [Phaeodactylibacter xiamenensis]|uniref:DUF7948 domain-containing protein n=1 Tax=Phaeodactylibacter xiamenensis TaxID=1524460 RepID=UPI0024A9FE99